MGTMVSRIQGLCGRMQLRKASIVMIGPSNSGKTTILYKLKLYENVKPIPTSTYIVETVDIFQDISLLIWDVSLGAMGRPLKKSFLDHCQGFLFVVDSKDTQTFCDAQEDLFYAVNMLEDNVPFIVLANKQDLKGACSTSEMVHHLKLNDIRQNNWDVCGCSGITGEGLHEALEKLCTMITEHELRR